MPLYLTLLHIAFGTELALLTPIIALLLVVGFATSFIQAALQIEDATFALLPKTIAMILIGLTGGFGLLSGFERLAALFIARAPYLVHQSWY
ncbi:flagellar biosynthetic protein FliQ [Acidocella sp.]|uniref:flagellar biosynthetic protein FliQ n=1 Tax=Acidocella sp. TaxID=50710 RepID=UPI00260E7D69|nr:flagellar biosynthetic protein FliQ [Acidocella sp.]